MKYMVIIIDHKLKWCEHISYIKDKVSKGICIIFKKSRTVLEKLCLLFGTEKGCQNDNIITFFHHTTLLLSLQSII